MKSTTIFTVAALLAALSACGDGPTEIKKPPPPPVAPTITPDASNLNEWVVSTTQTMKFNLSPATSTCTAAHDNTEPIAGAYQNRTVIQSVTSSGVTVVVQNSVFKGKPNLSVTLTCVNGSSAATTHAFNYPLVSAPLVITGTSVVRSVAANGSVIYEVTYTGSGFSTYNGDTGFSYTGTLCGTDGRAPVGVRWESPTKIVGGISGGPDFNWSGNHTYRCVTSDPKGSSVSGAFVVP